MRKSMTASATELYRGCNLSSGRRDAQQRTNIRRKQNDAVVIPSPTSGGPRKVGHVLCCATSSIEAFNPYSCKEANRQTVRRPKRINGSVGSRQRLRGLRPERSQPQTRCTVA